MSALTVEEIGVDDPFPLELDATKPMITSAWGRKGAGKSVFSRSIYDAWPYDKLAIDVNGDADPGPDAEKLTGDLPKRFPPPPDKPLGDVSRPRPRNLHYRANPMSATYHEDLDKAVGLALFPQGQRVCLWGGEVGELMPNGRPGPRMRTVLMQNRHYNVTALFDGPRPVFVDPLVIGQSDLVAVYTLPNIADRQRVATTIGYPAKRFEAEYEETQRRGKWWFLLWHADHETLYRMAPLPIAPGRDQGYAPAAAR